MPRETERVREGIAMSKAYPDEHQRYWMASALVARAHGLFDLAQAFDGNAIGDRNCRGACCCGAPLDCSLGYGDSVAKAAVEMAYLGYSTGRSAT
jgi:hypothetical protein